MPGGPRAGEVGHRGGDVLKSDEVGQPSARRDARPTDRERDLDVLDVRGVLAVGLAVLAEVEAVVRDQEDVGVVELTVLLERCDQAVVEVVEGLEPFEPALPHMVAEVLGARAGGVGRGVGDRIVLRGTARRSYPLGRELGVPGDIARLVGGVVLVEARSAWRPRAVMRVRVAVRGLALPVRDLVGEREEERPACAAVRLHEPRRLHGQTVRRMPAVGGVLAGRAAEPPGAAEDAVVVAVAVAVEVLAHEARRVAAATQAMGTVRDSSPRSRKRRSLPNRSRVRSLLW